MGVKTPAGAAPNSAENYVGNFPPLQALNVVRCDATTCTSVIEPEYTGKIVDNYAAFNSEAFGVHCMNDEVAAAATGSKLCALTGSATTTTTGGNMVDVRRNIMTLAVARCSPVQSEAGGAGVLYACHALQGVAPYTGVPPAAGSGPETAVGPN